MSKEITSLDIEKKFIGLLSKHYGQIALTKNVESEGFFNDIYDEILKDKTGSCSKSPRTCTDFYEITIKLYRIGLVEIDIMLDDVENDTCYCISAEKTDFNLKNPIAPKRLKVFFENNAPVKTLDGIKLEDGRNTTFGGLIIYLTPKGYSTAFENQKHEDNLLILKQQTKTNTLLLTATSILATFAVLDFFVPLEARNAIFETLCFVFAIIIFPFYLSLS